MSVKNIIFAASSIREREMTKEAGSGVDVNSKLKQYVQRILDLGQKNKAIYFATSPDGQSDWKIKTLGFKLSEEALYDLLDQRLVDLLRVSTTRNEVRVSRIDFGESDWRDVEKRLRKLYSRNREFVKDYGVSICYIVYSFLIWQESPISGEGFWVKSPLLVAEANLEKKIDRRRGQVVYRVSLESPFRINESLAEILRLQYELDLREGLVEDGETAVEFENLDEIENVLSKFEAVALDMGWRIEREVWIAGLHFGTVGIYHDAKNLLKSGKLSQSPIIRALCGEAQEPPLPHPEPPKEREIDLLETPLPADKSQCEVLWYAERGSNLVVHGPPGTGKSQTIANLIARAIKNGRRVLFVAERREAIDVVYDRLRELGLTLPVLKVFTITKRERDQVLEDLLNTLRAVESQSRPLSGVVSFPEHEYDYEWEYFELLTRATDSKNLYKLIGDVALKEEELEKWGLIGLADKYYGRGVWQEYEKIDELSLRSYWDKVIEFFRLPLLPRRNELRVVSPMVSFLEEIEEKFGDISHQEVIELFEVINKLYNVLREPDAVQALGFCLKLDCSQLQSLHEVIQQLISSIKRLRKIRERLEILPDERELSEAEEKLCQYGSWLKRVFSNDYKALRAELENRLSISRRLSHEDALASVMWLKYERYDLVEEEEKEKQGIKDLVKRVKGEDYAPLILPLNIDQLNMVSHVVGRLLELEKSPKTARAVRLLNEDLQLFKNFADQISTKELDSIMSILVRIPESGGIRILLNFLHELQKVVSDIGGVGLDTVMDLIEQIRRSSSLEG
ncbi:MAG: hypothetical protein DRO36_05705, partial [Candidatus Hecatellales archaeon]